MKTVKRTVTRFIFAAAAALIFGASANAALPQDCKNVSTDKGAVNGKFMQKDSVCDYLGIPYAAQPVGELRFAKPVEHEAWSAPLEAVKYGAKCPQLNMPIVSSNEPADEACLYLNVWQPIKGADKKPVMVFIHGGGFMYGSGGDLFASEKLSSMGDVIAVTINYRLGALGFLAHPALKDKEGLSGNYGMYDQLAAIKWVKKNIANFGGDPDNITIFGESAGGMSVGLHLASPLDKGLFRQAVIESGPVLMLNTSLADAEKIGSKAADKLGCTDPKTAADCLRKIPADRFYKDLNQAIFFFANPGDENYYIGPIIDGGFLPDNPYRIFNTGKFNTDVKVMLGTNSDEATMLTRARNVNTANDFARAVKNDVLLIKDSFGIDPYANNYLDKYPLASYKSPADAYNDLICDIAFTCPTRVLANLITKWQPDAYLYYFSKAPSAQPPFDKAKAFHGSELLFVFRKFSIMGMKLDTKENLAVSDTVIGLWTSFAHTGVPTAASAPAWPKYDARTQPFMHIDVKPVVENALKSDRCAILDKNLQAGFEK